MKSQESRKFDWFLFITLHLWIYSCHIPEQRKEDIIRVRLTQEPNNLNGFLLGDLNKNTILSYLQWAPLAVDPVLLDWMPLVAKDVPQTELQPDGTLKVTIQIRDEVTWDNGDSLTADDVLFSFKLLFCHGLSSPVFPFFYIIKNVNG